MVRNIAQEFARAFYNSARWQKCRTSYIKYRESIDGGLCETCRQAKGKIVHHRQWLTPENIDDDSVSLNFDNLRYDCQECHNREEHDDSIYLKYYFDDEGNVKPLPP